MNFVTQKTVAPRLLTAAFALAALAVSGGTLRAQTPAAAPAADAPILITPAQWLLRQPKPTFKPGHTMPRLTRYGWDLSVDTFKVLAEDWNYALQTNYLSEDQKVLERFDDPTSREGQMMALTLSDPNKYPLAVVLSRDEPADQVPEAFLRDANGKLIDDQQIYSPIAPQIAYDKMAEERARPLRALRKKVPINMVLNAGEYGLGVAGFIRDKAAQDPTAAAAQAESGLDWVSFISKAKRRETETIGEAARKAVPDRSLYVYYATGSPDRNRYGGWRDWGGDPEDGLNASDLPATEHYYKHFNTGYLSAREPYSNNDMLSRALNSFGFQFGHGKKFFYDWLAAGWTGEPYSNDLLPVAAPKPAAEGISKPQLQEGNLSMLVDPTAGEMSPMNLYTGFLKCIFTAGTIGANAGYYSEPRGGFDASFPADKSPYYLTQMTALSQVQALFSHLEDDLRNSDLLPGPNKHGMSGDQPAYEFPTGDAHTRVLARKNEGEEKWLVTAWAADGVERPVTVTIPELGKVTLLARGAGSVYTVTLEGGKAQLMLNDSDAMEPTTKGFAPEKVTEAQILATVAKAPTTPLMTNLQLWFDAAKGVETDNEGGVISWTPQGALADWQVSSKPAGKPVWVKDAANGLPAVIFRGDNKGLFSRELDAAAGFGGTQKTIFAVYASSVPFGYEGQGCRFLQTAIVGEGAPIIFVVGNPPNPEKQTWQVNMLVTDVAARTIYLALGTMVTAEGSPAGGRDFNGDLAEILVYDGTLVPAQQFQVQQYLKAKYKLGL